MKTTQEAAPIFAAVWERKLLVCAVVSASLLVGIAYTLLAPAVWEAKATVIFPVRQPSALGVTGGDASALASALGGPTPVRVYAGILESARTTQYVGDKLGIARRDVEQMSRVIDQAMENTITVSARSTDAELAKRVVALRLEALETINEELNMPLAANDVAVLGEEIESREKAISGLEEQLVKFQGEALTAPGVTTSGTGKETTFVSNSSRWVGALRDLEIERAKVESAIGQIQSWSAQVAEDGKDLPTPFPGTEKWRATLETLEYDMRVKELSYSPSAPEITKLRDEIAIAKKQLESELAKYAEATRTGLIDPTFSSAAKLPELLAQRVAVEAQLRAVQRLARLAPQESVDLSRLMREIATQTVILQQLQAQRQFASIQQARDPNRWEVLDDPYVEDKPLNKSLLRNGATSLFAGLLIAVCAAMLLGRPSRLRVERDEHYDEAA